jgi:hypothetical protein
MGTRKCNYGGDGGFPAAVRPEKAPAAFLLVMAGANRRKEPPSVGRARGKWLGIDS